MSLSWLPHKPPFLRGQTFVATEQASWLVLRLHVIVVPRRHSCGTAPGSNRTSLDP